MFIVKKRFEVSGSHSLNLPYESKCKNIHGHNWIITVECKSETLNESGMVTDFAHIKKQVSEKLDHAHLNDVIPNNPTAENIAKWIADQIPTCNRVTIQESEGNVAIYEN